jgi:hypothetical protein
MNISISSVPLESPFSLLPPSPFSPGGRPAAQKIPKQKKLFQPRVTWEVGVEILGVNKNIPL